MPRLHNPDYKFVSAIGLLLVLGLIILSSASSVLGYEKFQDTFYYLKHQLFYGVIPGLIAMYVFSKIDYHVWRKYGLWLLGFSVVLLVAVFIPGLGAKYGGAQSWIVIGSFSLQPAEIVKLTFLLYLAAWLERREHGIKDIAYGLIPFTIILGIVAGLIIIQPDVGTVSIIIAMAFMVYFAAGAPFTHLSVLGAGGLGALYALIKFAPYRAARFAAFMNPELDPQNTGYHIKQSLLAIGSGGIFGLGLGHSRQKFTYLPEAAGDSIFAVAAEELGFLLSVVIIGLFVFVILRGLRIGRAAPDMFGTLVSAGIVGWIGWQMVVNIGAMVGLMPLTGIPLPLISYGGTAMLTSLAAIGILINISRQTGQRVAVRDNSKVVKRKK